MLRNQRGGTSLRWLRQLLDHGIEAHAQVVLCPAVNDGDVLDSTLHGLLENFPELLSVAVVPLGLSRHNTEARMRVHTPEEAAAAVSLIESWQARYVAVLGRTVVHAADELYLRADLPLPGAARYGGFEMLEDGIGIARSFTDAFRGERSDLRHHDGGFFGSIDATSYVRAVNPAAETSLRHRTVPVSITMRPRTEHERLAVITGELGARVISPLVNDLTGGDVEVIAVRNDYFGGNTAVAGLLTFDDVSRALRGRPATTLHLLPDVCLNGDRFLDGHTVGDLSELHSIEIVPTSGTALRARIEQFLGGPS
jgi:NifB/MoaA-like Fe-S oxidoreductase